MNTCPYHKIRSELPPLPDRIKKLPVDARGYPVPYFVAYPNGPTEDPDFRMVDGEKVRCCIRFGLCWVCGEPLGRFKAFVIGPMCSVNRISSEPPSHVECAEFSVKGCPFLTRPNMVRREDETTENKPPIGGIMIKRNPGVSLIWITASYTVFPDGQGGRLIRIGDPEPLAVDRYSIERRFAVSWWREGRPATREEAEEAIRAGLPALEAVCRNDADREDLRKLVEQSKQFLPL